MKTDIFKILASREPLPVNPKYKDPYIMYDYATSLFSMNELPKTVEMTDGYFRRFIIVPFGVRIPDEEQDHDLARKIINSEMSGVLNYVVRGVKSLLEEGRFDIPDAAREAVESFQQESDTVWTFLAENGIRPNEEYCINFRDMFNDYIKQTNADRRIPVGKKTFAERLRNLGYVVKKVGHYNTTVVFALGDQERRRIELAKNDEVPV